MWYMYRKPNVFKCNLPLFELQIGYPTESFREYTKIIMVIQMVRFTDVGYRLRYGFEASLGICHSTGIAFKGI